MLLAGRLKSSLVAATVAMSTVSTVLALVLDGIAMSAKTSSSLKKALSYRAVEILLVDNHGLQKVSLQSPLGSCADVADCQQVAEVFDDEKIPVHEKQDDYKTKQDLKSKHDKEFKFKKAKAKTQETIKIAKLMENEKIEEHDAHVIESYFGVVVKDSSSQTCSISEILNIKQNLQAEHDQLVTDMINVKYWVKWDLQDDMINEYEQTKKKWKEFVGKPKNDLVR